MANETTATSLDDLFPTIIAQAMFTAEEQSIMRGLVKNFDIGSTAGTTIQVPKYSQPSAAALTDGTDMAATEVTTSSVSIAVGEHGVRADLTDMAVRGSGNAASDIGTVLGSAVATKLDTDLIGLFDGFSTSLGASTTELSVDYVAQAVATLRNAKVHGQLVGVFNPLQLYAMINSLTAAGVNPNAGDMQNQAMREGFVARIHGVNIFSSANVAVDGSGDSKGAIFAVDALGLAMKRDIDIEPERNASLRAWELNATAVYGVGELDDTYGVEMYFDAGI